VSYSPSIVTTVWLYLVSFLRQSEILVENHDFFIPLAFDAPVRGGGPRGNIAMPFGTGKLKWCAYLTVKIVLGHI